MSDPSARVPVPCVVCSQPLHEAYAMWCTNCAHQCHTYCGWRKEQWCATCYPRQSKMTALVVLGILVGAAVGVVYLGEKASHAHVSVSGLKE
jgi:hypothetical protein